MWIVAIAWMYVAMMMALAEATSPQGSVLGAIITIIFYGVAPLALVMYLLGTPGRRRARLQAEAQTRRGQEAKPVSDPTSAQTDASSLASGDAVPAVGKESDGV